MRRERRDYFKKIAPAAILSLKEALTHVYWYKTDLRSFLTQSLSDPSLLSRLNWQAYKRNIVSSLVDYLARNEDVFQRDLLRLMTDVAAIQDFTHLRRLDDGEAKEKKATAAVKALRVQVQGLQQLLKEESEIERRRETAHQKLMSNAAVSERLSELTTDYLALLSADAHARGYKLEKILRELFELFDLDPKASFRITGEQIDGAFSFEGTDYLFEAKWQANPVNAADLDVLAGKLSRKLDNTLGLFLSINGFSAEGVMQHSSGRRLIVLMDGADLMAILEGRIDLIQLLRRKRRAASQTGNIYLTIQQIMLGKSQ